MPAQDAKGGKGAPRAPGEHFKGDIELTLWNHTKYGIHSIMLAAPYADPKSAPYDGARDSDWIISKSDNA